MGLRRLRHLIVAAEELSFRRAALRLDADQSVISRHLRDIEGEFGADLLHREPGHGGAVDGGRSPPARKRMRIDGGGYRRDHLRAFAQRGEVAGRQVFIKGWKGELCARLSPSEAGNRRARFGSEMAGSARRR